MGLTVAVAAVAALTVGPPVASAASPPLSPEQVEFYKAFGVEPEELAKARMREYLVHGFTPVQRAAVNAVEDLTLRKKILQKLTAASRAFGSRPVRVGGPIAIAYGIPLVYDWLSADNGEVERSLLPENLGPDNLVELEPVTYSGPGDLSYTDFPDQWTLSEWQKTYSEDVCGDLGVTPCFEYRLVTDAHHGDGQTWEEPGWEINWGKFLDTDWCEDNFSPACSGQLGNQGNSNAGTDWAWYLTRARWASVKAIGAAWGAHLVETTVDHSDFFQSDPTTNTTADAHYYRLLLTPGEMEQIIYGEQTGIEHYPDNATAGDHAGQDVTTAPAWNTQRANSVKLVMRDDCGVKLVAWIVSDGEFSLPSVCTETGTIPEEPGTEPEPSTEEVTVFAPGLNETYWAYITRLRAGGWLGDYDVTVYDDADYEDYAGPNAVARITSYDSNWSYKRYQFAVPYPRINRYEYLEFEVNPPTAPGGIPTAGETGGSDGGLPGGVCSDVDVGSVDFSPLQDIDPGGVFPFGVFAWVGDAFGQLAGEGSSAPSFAIPVPSPTGSGIESVDVDLAVFDDEMPYVRSVLLFASTVLLLYALATGVLGIGGGREENA